MKLQKIKLNKTRRVIALMTLAIGLGVVMILVSQSRATKSQPTTQTSEFVTLKSSNFILQKRSKIEPSAQAQRVDKSRAGKPSTRYDWNHKPDPFLQ